MLSPFRTGWIPLTETRHRGTAAADAARAIQTLLCNAQSLDPLVYAGVATLFAGVATLACLVPSLRVSRIDPLVALRAD